MTRIEAFYRGTGKDARGRTLEDLWTMPDGRMESVHDFIQWMFPLPEPSGFNPDAPLLRKEDFAAFAAEPALRENLRRSFGRFLAFLGLRMDGPDLARAEDFEAKSHLWRVPNHNWLRITRVLRSCRLLGLGAEGRALLAFLRDLRDGGGTAIGDDTFRYWREAAMPDQPSKGS